MAAEKKAVLTARRRPRARSSSRGSSLLSPAVANIASQEKRIQRAERERRENRRYTSTIKTYFRRLEAAVAAGGDATADAELIALTRTIDKAVKRGAMHRNTGARKKSRASRVRRGASASA